MKLRTTVAAGVLLLLGVGKAAAQEDETPDITDIEIPTLVLDTGAEGDDDGGGGDIDLANIVQSAARSVTTVQEAPAIVTVITEDEIKDRRVNRVDDLVDSAVPGFLRVDVLYGQFPHAVARGQIQAVQFLHDGISMFDPFVNTAAVNQVQPMELIKRVEVISGPGGVLWGSNSLLGIINVITKDAEDVDGVEVGVDAGHGNGDRKYFHAYLMAGKTNLWSDESKILVHGSFKTLQGNALTAPNHMFSQPLPNPNSPVFFGPLTTAEQAQTYMFTAFVKLSLSNQTQLRVFAPFQDRHLPATFPGAIIRQNLDEDARPECNDGINPDGSDGCIDEGRLARDNSIDSFDRYAVLEYKNRMAGGKAGISAKAYAVQFVRNFKHLQILPASEALLEGGLGFSFNATTYRPGVAIDGDFELGKKARVLYGVEGFREFALNDVTRSRQGDGVESNFFGPVILDRLPLPCPLTRDLDTLMPVRIPGCPLTFAFPSDRTVLGAYVSPEVRPSKKLILTAGARAQVAPEALSTNPYDLTATFAGSAVYNFKEGFHLKAQFTQGFRPPVFNNVSSNGEAVQIDGRPDLAVETTDAIQGEINGRVFKGDRRIRELDFRVDYSYTRVQNLIQIVSGRYENTADRGISSGELLSTLYIDGGHKLQLGYTYLRVDTADKGVVRTLPNNWFNLLAVFNLVDGKLTASTDLRVVGAMEDYNRLVEYRDASYCTEADVTAGIMCQPGDMLNGSSKGVISTSPNDMVLDRLPPSASLMAGLTFQATDKLVLEGEVWNAFNGHFYEADVFGELEPRLEFVPNPEPEFRAYVSATYNY